MADREGPDGSAERTRSLRMAASAESVPEIRRAIVEDLTRLGIPEDVIDEAELVVSELTSNALRHARPLADGAIKVRWRSKAGVVELEVTDGGSPSVPRPAPIAVWASNGRGLRIVRSVAHEWGVIGDATGRTIWASLGGPSRRRGTESLTAGEPVPAVRRRPMSGGP